MRIPSTRRPRCRPIDSSNGELSPNSGTVLSERTLSKIRTQDTGSAGAERHLLDLGARPRRPHEDPPREWLREALRTIGAQTRRHPGNFRYLWRLGTPPSERRRVHIALPATPYPKADVDLVAA